MGFPLVVSGGGLVPSINGDWTGFVPGSPVGTNACTNPTSRDVDVMFSEITNGGISAAVKSTRQRDGVPPEFTVNVQNFSGRDLTLRFEISDAAPSEDWSMAQTLEPPASVSGDDNVIDVKILRNSSVTKSVYYRWRSGTLPVPAAAVTVRVYEVPAIGAPAPTPGGVRTSVSYVPATAGPLTGGAAFGVTSVPPLVSTSSFKYKGQPSNQLIENQLIENQLIENQLIENQLIENQLIENQLIENSLVEDQQILWTVTGAGALTTAVTAFSNLANGQELLQAGWQFQFLVYQTQLNPRVAGCQQVSVPTDVLLSNIAITKPNQLIENQLLENFQVSNQLIENQLIENQLIENSPISEQVSNATFSLDPSEWATVALRAFRPTTGPGAALTWQTNEIGQAAFSQVRDTDPVTGAPVDIATFYDQTPPVITPVVNGTEGTNGWYISAVTVTWVVTDPQSGIASRTGCEPVTLSADTAGTALECSAVNRMNLSSTASITIKVDTHAPTVTAAVSPAAPGSTGWYNAATGRPTISFTCRDDLSGVLACPGPTTAGEGRNQTFSSGPVSDVAGNAALPVTISGINVDTVLPTIVLTTPGDQRTYLLNAVVATSYACSDATGSGVAACAGPVASGAALPTSTVGQKTFTVSARDVAGNTATATSTYAVAYVFLLSAPKSPSTLGNVVPLTWQLKDGMGSIVADLASLITLSSVFSPKPSTGSCQVNLAGPTVRLYDPATGAAGGSDFRFIQSSSSYRFNWDTKSAMGTGPGCYTLLWKLKDSTTQRAVVELK